jgi:hypothetical protein
MTERVEYAPFFGAAVIKREGGAYHEDVRPGHAHVWSDRLFCDGREHYSVCLLADCNERRYFCKHTRSCRL